MVTGSSSLFTFRGYGLTTLNCKRPHRVYPGGPKSGSYRSLFPNPVF